MNSIKLAIIFSFSACCSFADIVTPTRTIRANAIISATDLKMLAGSHPNAFDKVNDVVGQEARTNLYAGRPILFDEIGPPALVARNQIVKMRFSAGGLVIMTEGRSLERGGIGDHVRIMNLSSRSTLMGMVEADGTVTVAK